MKKMILASLAALGVAMPAFAQDAAPEPREKGVFDGVSFAGIVGLDVLTIQENDEADTARDVLFGGSIGYDRQVGRVVIGIQGEITSSGAAYKIENLLASGDRFESKAGRDLYAGVRVGLPTGRTLLYVGAGYVNSQLRSYYADATDSIEQTEEKGGFRVSMGAELQRKNIFGRIEMRYQDLGDYTVFALPTGYARTHTQIVAGAGVRF
ncbi:MAG: outer membrane beta-barrel protein [Sphingomonas sp.]|uniref:outer membrane protein n=1 Tax=Sphingomonas sp. TaxID=28214 RepID=UPI002273A5F9|nr:outer membrane beta-barrel protein [Sphingomonas sp.]MCX8476108.1 outer membrane beta-barrel protein [Sphingomonas sp.]